jgi:TolA-binding protein
MQKQIMEDYIKLADTYNALFTQSQEQEVQLQTQDTRIQELQDGIEQLQEVIQDDKKTHEKQAAVIEYLQQQASREGTPSSQASIPPSKTKSTKLPDPPILTNGKEPAYDDWIAKMQSKLEANADHFPTQALQIGYIQSRVAGTAALHINPRLRPNAANKFKTIEEIFEVLDKVFSDPDRRYTARQAYRKLYQNKDTFSTFWAEFQRLTVELDIDEETLIDDLRHKVNTKMQNALITEINPTSLHALARKCLLIDQNLQKLQIQDARSTRKTYTPASFLATPRAEIPYEKLQQNSYQKAYTKPYAPTPRLYRAPHSDPTKEKLMQEGRCFVCQQAGHCAIECPEKEKQKARIHEVSPTSTYTQEHEDMGKE